MGIRRKAAIPVLYVLGDPFTPPLLYQRLLTDGRGAIPGCRAELKVLNVLPSGPKIAKSSAAHHSAIESFSGGLGKGQAPAFLLAESKAGILALEIALRSRAPVSGFIWVHPVLGAGTSRFWLAALERLPFLLPLWKFFFFPKTRPNTQKLRSGSTFKEQIAYLRFVAAAPRIHELEQPEFPILLLCGDSSKRQERLFAEKLNEELPQSELIRFAHLGQWPLREEPELLRHFIKEFIMENDHPKASSILSFRKTAEYNWT